MPGFEPGLIARNYVCASHDCARSGDWYAVDMPREERQIPIVPHDITGADCPGCLVAQERGEVTDIICNECGAVIRTVPVADVERALVDLSMTTISTARCSRCGAIQTFPGFSSVEAFVCQECGLGTAIGHLVQ